jgi:aryl-alcohol dehydrogenase-like predicted oxidoreductase
MPKTPGRDPVAAVHVALDAGVRTVGTADAYLNENWSGEPCPGRREEVLLASTFG